MDIGKNIRARRKELNMTLEQLALEVGSDTGNLSRIERGQQEITTGKIEIFAKALNCSALDLVNPPNKELSTLPTGYARVPILDNLQIINWEKISKHIELFEIKEWLVVSSTSTDLFGFEISDSSMKPDFQIGDRVIIDPKIKIEAGDFVVAIDLYENVLFRKYQARGIIDGEQTFDLTPLNNDYPILSSTTEQLNLLGVMIEHRKYRQR